jgi:nucleoside-diphosphate-sugar epimerase
MKVFITGGTGYIGSAVVRAFLSIGHKVTGIARSEEKAKSLRLLGATPVAGDINRPDRFARTAAENDAIIHMAFDSTTGEVADRACVKALIGAAQSAKRPCVFIYTSGVWVLGDTGGKPADEDTPPDHPAQAVAWRPAHERQVLHAARGTLMTAVIRPGLVFGGHKGLIGRYYIDAVEGGAATYLGDGRNRTALVHVEDLAQLYRTVAENRVSGVFHGVDGRTVRIIDIAVASSKAAGKGGAVKSIPLDDARRRMGVLADALYLDQVVTARRSGEIGWKPKHGPFLEEAPAVFRN